MKSILMDTYQAQLLGSTAAGSSTLTTGQINMSGFESVLIELNVGTLTTGQTLGVLNVLGGAAANGSDAAQLVGATITVPDAAAGKLVYLEVLKPTNVQYLTLSLVRGSQAMQVLALNYILFSQKKMPNIALDATVVAAAVIVDPEIAATGVGTVTSTYGNSPIPVTTTQRTSS